MFSKLRVFALSATRKQCHYYYYYYYCCSYSCFPSRPPVAQQKRVIDKPPHLVRSIHRRVLSNKSRVLSYHSYCVPKAIHIKNKNFACIKNDYGYAGEDAFFTFKFQSSKVLPPHSTPTNHIHIHPNNTTNDPTTTTTTTTSTNNHSDDNHHHSHSDLSTLFIGVADGVGNIENPSKAKAAAQYSRQLMQSSIEFLNQCYLNPELFSISNRSTSPSTNTNAVDIVNPYYSNFVHKLASYASTQVSEVHQMQGASTLCTLAIEPTHAVNASASLDTGQIANNATVKKASARAMLSAWNLGDSGFCIFRRNETLKNYELILHSEPQLQHIGIPYQLGSLPNSNHINDGYNIEYELQSLDIVVVGSDGIWDNLFDHEISAIMEQSTKYYEQRADEKQIGFADCVHSHIAGGHLTHCIIKEALQNSMDPKKSTPWSEEMTESMDMIYNCGKPDDITCVVAFIH